MNDTTNGRRRNGRRRLGLLTGGLGLAASLAWMPAAPAAAAGAVQIDGVNADAQGSCTDVDTEFNFLMTGDLEGCWYLLDFDVVQETPGGIYQERGEELFVGCLVKDGVDVACGTFETTYKLTQKYGPDGVIHGRCQHPLVAGSGTGDFEGATGRIDFKEDVSAGVAYFRGHIALS